MAHHICKKSYVCCIKCHKAYCYGCYGECCQHWYLVDERQAKTAKPLIISFVKSAHICNSWQSRCAKCKTMFCTACCKRFHDVCYNCHCETCCDGNCYHSYNHDSDCDCTEPYISPDEEYVYIDKQRIQDLVAHERNANIYNKKIQMKRKKYKLSKQV
jgi:hypothetical protein